MQNILSQAIGKFWLHQALYFHVVHPTGTPLVFATRVVVKKFMKEALFQFCHILGIPAYSYSYYMRSCVQMTKHYNENYRIPPIKVSGT